VSYGAFCGAVETGYDPNEAFTDFAAYDIRFAAFPQIRFSRWGYAPSAVAVSFRPRSTGQDHCAEVLAVLCIGVEVPEALLLRALAESVPARPVSESVGQPVERHRVG
jgi:hypothetical protein